MRIPKLTLIIACAALILSGCIVEEESEFNYTLINESTHNLIIERYGSFDYNFQSTSRLELKSGSRISFNYSFNTPPFYGTDSLIFISDGVVLKKYTSLIETKSPLNLDSYSGGKAGYAHHITSYEYSYRIQDSDFKKK